MGEKNAVFAQQTLTKSSCRLLLDIVVIEGSLSTQHMHARHCSMVTRRYCPSTAAWQNLKMPKEIERKSNTNIMGGG